MPEMPSQLILIADDERLPLPYRIDTRPASEFSYATALNKLSNSRLFRPTASRPVFLVPGERQDYNEYGAMEDLGMTDAQDASLQMSAVLNLDNRAGISCVGAILTYLQRRRGSEFLQHDPQAEEAYGISRVERLTLRNTM